MIENFLVKKTITSGYLLVLGDGQGWQLIPTEGVRSEVGKLGRIMGLESFEPNGYRKLIFIRRGSVKTRCDDTTCRLNENVKVDLKRLGWKAHDLILLRVWSHEDVPDSICEMRHEDGDYERSILSMRLSLYPIYRQAQESGGLPFHAGLVERDGKGILLAAPAETGKSTCCRRLPPPWKALCDEETLVLSNNAEHYIAHPFPTWSDYFRKRFEHTWNVQRHLPLSAIFFLERAEDDEAVPVGQGESAVFMHQSAMQVCHRYWNSLDHDQVKTLKKKLFDNACELAKTVPAFKLRVSLNGRFWEKIEEVLP